MILLGIGSGLLWGVADFFGGLQSRRLPVLAVALWSQIAGGLVLLAVTLASGRALVWGEIAWGVGAGLCSGIALLLFYRGLAVGTMSIVAPVSACGAAMPVIAALMWGQIPGPLSGAGIALALAGIVLVSLQADERAQADARPRATLALGLGSALGFGMFYVLVDRGAALPGATPLWTICGARLGSLAILVAVALSGQRPTAWPGARMPFVAGVGIMDTAANALFAYASTLGNLGVAGVLASLYPVATVVLGRVILAERLKPLQQAGVVLALAGVALLSAR